jgi:hypothetical protein
MYNVQEWNDKIYRNADDSFVGGGMHAQEFWDEFKIKSYPLFEGRCYFFIPERWAEDVRLFIKQVQTELKDKVEFGQIKEKFCWLTVYYTSFGEDTDVRIKELIDECIDRLILKGVHPPRDIKGDING